MYNPFIIGENIYLRTIEALDINERYQRWFNDVEVCQFNDHHRFPLYREEMAKYYQEVIQSKNNLVLAIVDKVSDVHIGNIALHNIDAINRSAELTLIIGEKDFWGKGVATEACQLIITHGFGALNLHRIYCGTSAVNIGMQKVAEKLGFVREGVRRDGIYKDGQYHDLIEYRLLKEEYATKNSRGES